MQLHTLPCTGQPLPNKNNDPAHDVNDIKAETLPPVQLHLLPFQWAFLCSDPTTHSAIQHCHSPSCPIPWVSYFICPGSLPSLPSCPHNHSHNLLQETFQHPPLLPLPWHVPIFCELKMPLKSVMIYLSLVLKCS